MQGILRLVLDSEDTLDVCIDIVFISQNQHLNCLVKYPVAVKEHC